MPRIAGCAIQHALVQLPSKHPSRIHVPHPSPPSSTENDAFTEREAELLVVAKVMACSISATCSTPHWPTADIWTISTRRTSLWSVRCPKSRPYVPSCPCVPIAEKCETTKEYGHDSKLMCWTIRALISLTVFVPTASENCTQKMQTRSSKK